MDKGKLKNFAIEARKRLIDHVGARIRYILTHETVEFVAKADLVKKLRAAWENSNDHDAFIEMHAYTLFNRLIALRYMDVKGYNFVPVVSPRATGGDPAILADARNGIFQPDLPIDRERVSALLGGKVPIANPYNEAYKLLFIAACAGFNKTMPFMFEHLNSYTELLLPDDLLSANSIVAFINSNLGEEECENVEVIGWLYQYYISEKKDVLIKRKTRYSTEEIPFVTQLFTPRWMVEYITQNSLGRFWLEARRNSGIREAMQFFIEPTEGNPFVERQLDSPEKITVLDPACGSGHMLVYAFELLFKMYQEEGYYNSDIPEKIIRNNLFGLEIDERATALAKFAILMKGREHDRNLLTKGIEPNIYCFFEDEDDPLFRNGKTLGSLIPTTETGLFPTGASEEVLIDETRKRNRENILKILNTRHDILVTNPPYVNSGYYSDALRSFLQKNYKDYGADLFSVFIVKGFDLVKQGGYLGYVTPFNWMFLSSFEKLRQLLISDKTIVTLVRPSFHAFFESAFVSLTSFVINNRHQKNSSAFYFDLDHLGNADNQVPRFLEGINNPASKRRFLQHQSNFSKIPGWPIAYWVSERIMELFSKKNSCLSNLVKPMKGLDTCDNDRFIRIWAEVAFNNIGLKKDSYDFKDKRWYGYAKGGDARRWYGNNDYVVDWQNDGSVLRNLRNDEGKIKSRPQNIAYYFLEGATWSSISSNTITLRYFSNSIFGGGGSALFAQNDLPMVIGFINSKLVQFFLDILNPTMNILVGDLMNLPVIWSQESTQKSEIVNIVQNSISISREDWDARETSWDFEASPLLTASDSPLLEERYRDYKRYWADKFFELHRNEEELNRIFIDIYGLQEELTPDVELKDVTILQQEKIITEEGGLAFNTAEVVRQFISYAVGCMFGRYSLDAPGLILANQGETLSDYLAKVPEPRFTPDDDNIIPVLDDEYFHDDIVFRFNRFLEAALGSEGFDSNLQFIESALGMTLRRYFTNEFYKDHLKRYKKRPIYWMVSSPAGSFKALIYMHRYNTQTMSKIYNDYLKEFASKLNARLKDLQDGIIHTPNPVREEEKLRRAIKDTEDLLIALTPFALNPVEIDLDDGVKANLLKFKGAVVQV